MKAEEYIATPRKLSRRRICSEDQHPALHSPRKLSGQVSAATTRPAGFTLIEIMVVIVIIMILAGIVVAAAKYVQTRAARSRAEAEIAMMETALENYKNDNGVYPPTLAGRPANASTLPYGNSPVLYTALAGGPGNPKTYFTFKRNQIHAVSATQTNIVDPFGTPYSYYCNPGAADQKNGVTFDLWSYGPDSQDNTADDIVNWRQ